MQVLYAPEVLACGQCFGGLLPFTVMSNVGPSLQEAVLDLTDDQLIDLATQSLHAIHGANIIHRSPEPQHMCVSDGKIKFVGFSQAKLSSLEQEKAAEMTKMQTALRLWMVSSLIMSECSAVQDLCWLLLL